MPIKDIQERYRTLGNLRMGEIDTSGSKPRPKRLDTWRLTSPSKELLEKAAAIWGGDVEVWENAPTEGEQFELTTEVSALAVIVPPQDIDANAWYELWSASGIKRRCDGETDMISGRACPCALKETRDCKPTTYLKVMLPEIPDIGTWRLVTRGWNAAAEIPQIVRLLNQIAPRTFAEASLRIESRTSKSENAAGKTETHHFVVPVLELPFTMGDLMQHAPAELTAGRGGRVGLPGDAPALPEDSRFAHDRETDWGAPAALPSVDEAGGHTVDLPSEDTPASSATSSEEVDGPGHSYGEGESAATPSASSESSSSGGEDDGALGTSPGTVSPSVQPPEDQTSEGGAGASVTHAPPSDDLDDEPAATWRWKNATAMGLTGSAALKRVRALVEAGTLPGPQPATQSAVTNRQLQWCIEEKRK